MAERISGVLSPVLTPFKSGYVPDAERLISHCRWLLGNDVSLAVFGTNSEANSLSEGERSDLLERLVAAGIDPRRLMPGTGCCSVTETVRLTAQAVKLGCAGVLMLPPFYYKGVTDEGLYRSFAETIERVGDKRLRIYLYHIPPVAQVGISLDLIERLLKAYPETIAGKGAISATANVNPAKIAALYRGWASADADQMQAGLDGVRKVFAKYPMIAAMKRAVAHWRRDEDWSRVRPPLVEIASRESAALVAELEAAGFDMPGL